MRKIQSRRPEKNHVKSCSTTPYLSFHLILSPPQRPLCVVGGRGGGGGLGEGEKENESAGFFDYCYFYWKT